jgi:microcystin-dependent protein
MSRPTLNTGDVWSESLANASGYPILDGASTFGHGPKVIDGWLDDGSDQIKAQFYGWKNRIKITQVSGLSVSYTSAVALLTNGNSVSINAGSITLPNNTLGRIYIDDTGAVVQGLNFPQLCVPLAYFVTSGGAITTLADLRYQSVEIVRPVSISATSIFSVGDIKESARSAPETGWLLCDGTSYAVATYPLLHNAIGTTYNNSGDPLGTFRVPDCRQRATIGAGTDGVLTNRPLGTKVGSETVTLTVAQMPPHAHNASQAAHTHGVNDPGHTHPISDPGHAHSFAPIPHAHGVSDPGHSHGIAVGDVDRSAGQIDDFIDAVDGSFTKRVTPFPIRAAGTNIGIFAANAGGSIGISGTGLSISSRTAGITTQNASPAITISNQGGGAPAPVTQPSIVLSKFIRAF